VRKSLAAGICVFAGVAFILLPARRASAPSTRSAPADAREARVLSPAARHEALRRAKVRTRTRAANFDFAMNPPDPSGLLSAPLVTCQYRGKEAHGTTPKFDCVLQDGEVVKVKYGPTAEIPAEIAASRLLSAIGFGADRVYLVPRVRCYGCGRSPFYAAWILDRFHLRRALTDALPAGGYTDFEWAAVERPFPGVEVETEDGSGWAWYELDTIDSTVGATRAEVDALRLAAVFVGHWDNKSENQRLVCADTPVSGRCAEPFAFIQDLGSSFGPRKLDLNRWQQTPVWADRDRCRVSMRDMPYAGGTFGDVEISEEGRQLLARELTRLTEAQIVTLFSAARVPEFAATGAAADARAWAAAFRAKVRQIADGNACSNSTTEARSEPPSGT
jgi:hypothetical protein